MNFSRFETCFGSQWDLTVKRFLSWAADLLNQTKHAEVKTQQSNEQRAPGCLGFLLGMKYYAVM